MPEEIQNIFDDVVELKKANPWLAAFALTDNEVKEIIKLISRIILGAVNINSFFSELTRVIRKDEMMVKKIAISAIQNRFMPLKDQISGVEQLLTKLGGSIKITEQTKTESEIKPTTPVSFSHEDDEEIKKIISSYKNSFKMHDYSSLAQLIIAESGYSTNGDEVILSRLKGIIIARLKDIRDEMETIEALKKSRKIGGLEMADEQAKKIISLVKEKIDQGLLSLIDLPAPSAQIAPAEKPSASINNISFPIKKPFVAVKTTLEAKKNNFIIQEPLVELKKVEENKIEKPVLSLVLKIEEEDGLPVIKSPQGDDLMIKPKIVGFNQAKKVPSINYEKAAKIFPTTSQVSSVPPPPVTSPKLEEIKIAIKQPVVAPQPQPMAKFTPLPKNIRFGKQSVDGVRVGKMLVGPIDELATMTMINFRRLGEMPHQSIAKIKEKIELLEKDSYGKKLEGVEAWHKSEVNRFYRLLGQESMRQGRSIDDIISERINENKPTLSIEEFNSVMELNKQLRY